MIQYGLWFNDSLNGRQGVRQTARDGVVHNFPTSCGAFTAELDKLRCAAKTNIGALTGTAYVKIYTPTSWTKGQPLTVCTMIPSGASNFGIFPLPNGGLIKSKTQMSIEVATPVVAVLSSADGSLPAGTDWTWC